MSKKFAMVIGGMVEAVVIADDALETGHLWIDITNADPMPGPRWKYENGNFVDSDTTPKNRNPPIVTEFIP